MISECENVYLDYAQLPCRDELQSLKTRGVLMISECRNVYLDFTLAVLTY